MTDKTKTNDWKALFLAQGKIDCDNSRYRAWWVAEAADWAKCVSIETITSVSNSINSNYDTVVFPSLCDSNTVELMRKCQDEGKIVVWDIYNPLWWTHPRETQEIFDAQLIDKIVVSNEGLAEDLRRTFCRSSTIITDRMAPAFHSSTKQHKSVEYPILLWFGENDLLSLNGVLLTLHRLAAEGVQFRLRILDDGARDEVHIDGVDVEYHRWRLEAFHDELCAADVVLTPTYPGPWGRMKSINRQVSAWWAGLPTASGENPAQLKLLLTDARFRAEVGLHNRRLAEARYDVAQSVAEWKSLLEC